MDRSDSAMVARLAEAVVALSAAVDYLIQVRPAGSRLDDQMTKLVADAREEASRVRTAFRG